MATFTLDDPEPMLYVNEPILRNGEVVGQIRSGAYAHLLGTSVGMGYLNNPEGVTNDWITSGSYEILVEGKKIPAKAHIRSPYDPRNERTKM